MRASALGRSMLSLCAVIAVATIVPNGTEAASFFATDRVSTVVFLRNEPVKADGFRDEWNLLDGTLGSDGYFYFTSDVYNIDDALVGSRLFRMHSESGLIFQLAEGVDLPPSTTSGTLSSSRYQFVGDLAELSSGKLVSILDPTAGLLAVIDLPSDHVEVVRVDSAGAPLAGSLLPDPRGGLWLLIGDRWTWVGEDGSQLGSRPAHDGTNFLDAMGVSSNGDLIALAYFPLRVVRITEADTIIDVAPIPGHEGMEVRPWEGHSRLVDDDTAVVVLNYVSATLGLTFGSELHSVDLSTGEVTRVAGDYRSSNHSDGTDGTATSSAFYATRIGGVTPSGALLTIDDFIGSSEIFVRRVGGAMLGPSDRLCFPVAGSPGDAAVVNLTPVLAQGAGSGQLVSSSVVSPRVASNVNFVRGVIDPNVAIAPIGPDGEVCFVNSAHTDVHLVADHLGTVAAESFVPATSSGAPARRVDTRIAFMAAVP